MRVDVFLFLKLVNSLDLTVPFSKRAWTAKISKQWINRESQKLRQLTGKDYFYSERDMENKLFYDEDELRQLLHLFDSLLNVDLKKAVNGFCITHPRYFHESDEYVDFDQLELDIQKYFTVNVNIPFVYQVTTDPLIYPVKMDGSNPHAVMDSPTAISLLRVALDVNEAFHTKKRTDPTIANEVFVEPFENPESLSKFERSVSTQLSVPANIHWGIYNAMSSTEDTRLGIFQLQPNLYGTNLSHTTPAFMPLVAPPVLKLLDTNRALSKKKYEFSGEKIDQPTHQPVFDIHVYDSSVAMIDSISDMNASSVDDMLDHTTLVNYINKATELSGELLSTLFHSLRERIKVELNSPYEEEILPDISYEKLKQALESMFSGTDQQLSFLEKFRKFVKEQETTLDNNYIKMSISDFMKAEGLDTFSAEGIRFKEAITEKIQKINASSLFKEGISADDKEALLQDIDRIKESLRISTSASQKNNNASSGVGKKRLIKDTLGKRLLNSKIYDLLRSMRLSKDVASTVLNLSSQVRNLFRVISNPSNIEDITVLPKQFIQLDLFCNLFGQFMIFDETLSKIVLENLLQNFVVVPDISFLVVLNYENILLNSPSSSSKDQLHKDQKDPDVQQENVHELRKLYQEYQHLYEQYNIARARNAERVKLEGEINYLENHKEERIQDFMQEVSQEMYILNDINDSKSSSFNENVFKSSLGNIHVCATFMETSF